MGKRLTIERNGPDTMKPIFDAIAKAAETLGYSIRWWIRKNPLAPTDVLVWFHWHMTPDVVNRTRAARRHLFVEKGWFHDRDFCVQMDVAGANSTISWAKEPLAFTPSGKAPVLKDGCMFVFLRYEHGGKSLDNESPYFVNNMAWLKHLATSAEYCHIDVKVRPHFATPQMDNDTVRAFTRAQGWDWVDGSEFGDSLLAESRAVAVIDSTMGSKALAAGVPVLCYGNPVYRHPGVVYCMTNNNLMLRRTLLRLWTGKCDLDTGAMSAMVAKMRAKEWHLEDAAGFPERLQREFGL